MSSKKMVNQTHDLKYQAGCVTSVESVLVFKSILVFVISRIQLFSKRCAYHDKVKKCR
jgi:hypothetical protein